jgi:hypothetical protein
MEATRELDNAFKGSNRGRGRQKSKRPQALPTVSCGDAENDRCFHCWMEEVAEMFGSTDCDLPISLTIMSMMTEPEVPAGRKTSKMISPFACFQHDQNDDLSFILDLNKVDVFYSVFPRADGYCLSNVLMNIMDIQDYRTFTHQQAWIMFSVLAKEAISNLGIEADDEAKEEWDSIIEQKNLSFGSEYWTVLEETTENRNFRKKLGISSFHCGDFLFAVCRWKKLGLGALEASGRIRFDIPLSESCQALLRYCFYRCNDVGYEEITHFVLLAFHKPPPDYSSNPITTASLISQDDYLSQTLRTGSSSSSTQIALPTEHLLEQGITLGIFNHQTDPEEVQDEAQKISEQVQAVVDTIPGGNAQHISQQNVVLQSENQPEESQSHNDEGFPDQSHDEEWIRAMSAGAPFSTNSTRPEVGIEQKETSLLIHSSSAEASTKSSSGGQYVSANSASILGRVHEISLPISSHSDEPPAEASGAHSSMVRTIQQQPPSSIPSRSEESGAVASGAQSSIQQEASSPFDSVSDDDHQEFAAQTHSRPDQEPPPVKKRKKISSKTAIGNVDAPRTPVSKSKRSHVSVRHSPRLEQKFAESKKKATPKQKITNIESRKKQNGTVVVVRQKRKGKSLGKGGSFRASTSDLTYWSNVDEEREVDRNSTTPTCYGNPDHPTVAVHFASNWVDLPGNEEQNLKHVNMACKKAAEEDHLFILLSWSKNKTEMKACLQKMNVRKLLLFCHGAFADTNVRLDSGILVTKMNKQMKTVQTQTIDAILDLCPDSHIGFIFCDTRCKQFPVLVSL